MSTSTSIEAASVILERALVSSSNADLRDQIRALVAMGQACKELSQARRELSSTGLAVILQAELFRRGQK